MTQNVTVSQKQSSCGLDCDIVQRKQIHTYIFFCSGPYYSGFFMALWPYTPLNTPVLFLHLTSNHDETFWMLSATWRKRTRFLYWIELKCPGWASQWHCKTLKTKCNLKPQIKPPTYSVHMFYWNVWETLLPAATNSKCVLSKTVGISVCPYSWQGDVSRVMYDIVSCYMFWLSVSLSAMGPGVCLDYKFRARQQRKGSG